MLQESFLTVWRVAGDYRASLSPPLAWLGLIVRSRALDLLHIDANRLGVNPAEECVAGVCARYLLGGPGVAGASARR